MPLLYNSDMTMYLRFIGSLILGLAGLGFILTMVLDRFFGDQEILAAWRDVWKRLREGPEIAPAARAEDAGGLDSSSPRNLQTRLLDKRREQIREMNEVENKLTSRGAAYQEDWV